MSSNAADGAFEVLVRKRLGWQAVSLGPLAGKDLLRLDIRLRCIVEQAGLHACNQASEPQEVPVEDPSCEPPGAQGVQLSADDPVWEDASCLLGMLTAPAVTRISLELRRSMF